MLRTQRHIIHCSVEYLLSIYRRTTNSKWQDRIPNSREGAHRHTPEAAQPHAPLSSSRDIRLHPHMFSSAFSIEKDNDIAGFQKPARKHTHTVMDTL